MGSQSLSQWNIHLYSSFIQAMNMGCPRSSWDRDHGPINLATHRGKYCHGMKQVTVSPDRLWQKSPVSPWWTGSRQPGRAAALQRHVHTSATPGCLLLTSDFWYGLLFTSGSAENQLNFWIPFICDWSQILKLLLGWCSSLEHHQQTGPAGAPTAGNTVGRGALWGHNHKQTPAFFSTHCPAGHAAPSAMTKGDLCQPQWIKPWSVWAFLKINLNAATI